MICILWTFCVHIYCQTKQDPKQFVELEALAFLTHTKETHEALSAAAEILKPQTVSTCAYNRKNKSEELWLVLSTGQGGHESFGLRSEQSERRCSIPELERYVAWFKKEYPDLNHEEIIQGFEHKNSAEKNPEFYFEERKLIDR